MGGTSPQTDAIKKAIQELVDRYSAHQSEYESNGYLESQLRTDFLDELFKILGWDLVNKGRLSPYKERFLWKRETQRGAPIIHLG